MSTGVYLETQEERDRALRLSILNYFTASQRTKQIQGE